MGGRVAGKVALITGAARGQGRSHALRLAEEGADIIAVDVCKAVGINDSIPAANSDDLAETADLVERLGRRIVTAEVDVRDFDALDAAVHGAVYRLGRLDIVIANAGIADHGSSLDELGETDWQHMLDINLSGVWKTAKAGASHILAGALGGSIIVNSSVGGLKAYPRTGRYTAAKHGLVGMMTAFAVDLGQHGVRVNSVHPTNVGTPMFVNDVTKRLFRPELENPERQDLEVVGRLMHVLPVGWVESVDVSNAVLFLASDESRYITGVTLPVDAGATVK
jgi:SDR family mycofactocin-dependent oxidoreductase